MSKRKKTYYIDGKKVSKTKMLELLDKVGQFRSWVWNAEDNTWHDVAVVEDEDA